jgi:hypothetical protein
MRPIAWTFLAACALAAMVPASSQARDGCGRGGYFNGHRCVSAYDAGPRRYGYYPVPGTAPRGGGQYIGGGQFVDRSGGVGCVRPGFTIQDGVCKPYTGR